MGNVLEIDLLDVSEDGSLIECSDDVAVVSSRL